MSDIRVYVSESGRKSHRVVGQSTPEALIGMARVAAATQRQAPVEPCHCEHAEHFDGTAHPYGKVPADDFVAAYVGKICLVCATGHLAHFTFPVS